MAYNFVQANQQEEVLCKVIQFVVFGWPERFSPRKLVCFEHFQLRHHLSVVDNVLLLSTESAEPYIMISPVL